MADTVLTDLDYQRDSVGNPTRLIVVGLRSSGDHTSDRRCVVTLHCWPSSWPATDVSFGIKISVQPRTVP